ncbi:MAG: hypothetical protein WCV67_03160 [Victivallaceae bacterium]|jgi:hypothetical protein
MANINETLMTISNDVAVTKNTIRYVRQAQIEIKKSMFGADGTGGMLGTLNTLKNDLKKESEEHKACMIIRSKLEEEVKMLKEHKKEQDRIKAEKKARFKVACYLLTVSGVTLAGTFASLKWIWKIIRPFLTDNPQ